MKIVYIYTALLTQGGVDRVLSVKANYLADHLGHDVWIITDSQAGRPVVFPLSPQVHHIDLETDFDEQYHNGIIRRFMIYRRLMRQYRKRLKAKLNEIRPDIVCTTLGRDMDFLCDLHDGSRKVGESHIAKAFCRNFHLMEARGFPYKQIARYWRWKQERSVAKLDALVVLTQRDAASWSDVRKAQVIHNPCTIVPTGRADVVKSRTVVAVGRLGEQKAFHRLIAAWSKVAPLHPEWQLCIWGEGELQIDLQNQISELGLTASVHLCGISHNIEDCYQQGAFYAMTSRFEGFPLVLIEAMSCGLPLVAMDCPTGVREIVNDGENGLLVPDGDIEAMSSALCRMIESPSLRSSMSKRCLKIVEDRFCLPAVMNKWEKLFESLM